VNLVSTPELIRNHIEEQSPETLITTRAMIGYGTRKAVDCTISALVKKGILKRVARGVFAKRERKSPVTIEEVATVKANSFGRKLIKHAAKVAHMLGISEKSSSNEFEIDGRSSSFLFGDIRIRFKGTSPRKIALGDSPVGTIVRALCHLGRTKVDSETIAIATKGLTFKQRAEFGNLPM
jgi:hypothetical protein